MPHVLQTALHLAARANNPQMVKLLALYNADVNILAEYIVGSVSGDENSLPDLSVVCNFCLLIGVLFSASLGLSVSTTVCKDNLPRLWRYCLVVVYDVCL